MTQAMNNITSHFGINVDETRIRPLGDGLINDTYKVEAWPDYDHDYVLQRINHGVFQNVDILQSNIELVTEHLRAKMSGNETTGASCTLDFLPSVETGKTYYYDGANYWRMMVFIDDTYTRNEVSVENACHAGRAFGEFQRLLADLPDGLEESIPDFHNMEFRLSQFKEALRDDKASRRHNVADLINRLLARESHALLAENLYHTGKLPKRVCHCDTKINNMLFDVDGNVKCIVDLDTVMPSFVFSDFGDFLRTAANTASEDEPDLSKVEFDMEIFKAFTKGYLESAGSFLLPVEIENLPYAAERFAYMQSVRFLTDYLNGDVYYKTGYPEHNLVRARNQFKLLQSIEGHLDEMNTYIKDYSRL